MVVYRRVMTLVAFLFLRNQLRPIRRLARARGGVRQGTDDALQAIGRDRGARRGQCVSGHARPDRAADRAAHHDAVGGQPRPAHAADPAEAGPVDAGGGRTQRSLLRDVDEMERLLDEFLAFARGDALDDPEDVRSGRSGRAVVAENSRQGGAQVRLAGVDRRGHARCCARWRWRGRSTT